MIRALLLLSLLAPAARAADCDDAGKVYKICGDQEAAFAASVATAKKYVLADVGVYNGKKKVPSGEAILERIKAQAHYTKKIDGIPVLAVVNPEKDKAVIIDTEPLEKNTATTKGHDPKKVLAALEKAAGEVR